MSERAAMLYDAEWYHLPGGWAIDPRYHSTFRNRGLLPKVRLTSDMSCCFAKAPAVARIHFYCMRRLNHGGRHLSGFYVDEPSPYELERWAAALYVYVTAVWERKTLRSGENTIMQPVTRPT